MWHALAYLFHLVKNHPFVDGNKRVGLAIALAFLGIDDSFIRASVDELVELVLGVAESRSGKPDIAVFLRDPRGVAASTGAIDPCPLWAIGIVLEPRVRKAAARPR
jgi:prophage maintenance system killer protein